MKLSVRAYRPRGAELIFLVSLIVATAMLLGWLLVALARLAMGDLRYPRLGPTPQAAPSTPPERVAPAPVMAPRSSGAEPEPSTAEPDPDTALYDDSDAERLVREHLYGRRT